METKKVIAIVLLLGLLALGTLTIVSTTVSAAALGSGIVSPYSGACGSLPGHDHNDPRWGADYSDDEAQFMCLT